MPLGDARDVGALEGLGAFLYLEVLVPASALCVIVRFRVDAEPVLPCHRLGIGAMYRGSMPYVFGGEQLTFGIWRRGHFIILALFIDFRNNHCFTFREFANRTLGRVDGHQLYS